MKYQDLIDKSFQLELHTGKLLRNQLNTFE